MEQMSARDLSNEILKWMKFQFNSFYLEADSAGSKITFPPPLLQYWDGDASDPGQTGARDETHHPPLLTRLGSTGLVKKANVVGENELVNEYLLCKLCREYIIFHDKTQWIFDRSTCPRQCISALKITIKLDSDLGTNGLYEWHIT